MKLSMRVTNLEDGSQSVIDMPVSDADVDASVRVFGIILRTGTLPDMTQQLIDGTEFTVTGGGQLISDISLSFDHEDSGANDL